MTKTTPTRRWMASALRTARETQANLPFNRANRPARAARNVAEASRKQA